MPSAARAPCPALAIVTGAGSANGIGFATARRLALAGREVLLAGLSDRVHERAAELLAGGHRAHAFAGDLSDEAAVRALAAQAQSTGLPVAALVNNAGMAVGGELDSSAPVADMSLADWRRSIERNLTSCFLVSRAFVGGMAARGYGRIVNVSSTAGPTKIWSLFLAPDRIIPWPYTFAESFRLALRFQLKFWPRDPGAALRERVGEGLREADLPRGREARRYHVHLLRAIEVRSNSTANTVPIEKLSGETDEYAIARGETDIYRQVLGERYPDKYREKDFPTGALDKLVRK